MDQVTSKTEVKALGQGVNLSVLRDALSELEASCNLKIEASENFKNLITLKALQTGLLPGVLSQYIQARCSDSVSKKARSAEQLSLLFTEL